MSAPWPPRSWSWGWLGAWGGLSPLRLVLAGVALNALLGVLMGLVMILYADRVPTILGWTLDSLSGRSWPELRRTFPLIALGIGLAMGSARFLTVLLLQEDVARSLGIAVTWIRIWLVSIAALLAAGAVSATGLIGFVGLVIPHITRLLVGPDHRFLLPAAALLGGGLVVAADTVARTVAAPLELAVWAAHRFTVMQAGRLMAQGAPHDVLTPSLIAEVFGVKAWVCWDAEVGRLLCYPLGKTGKPTAHPWSRGEDSACRCFSKISFTSIQANEGD